jgi:hypothetical protein
MNMFFTYFQKALDELTEGWPFLAWFRVIVRKTKEGKLQKRKRKEMKRVKPLTIRRT